MSKPFEITLSPEQEAVFGASVAVLNDLFLKDPARYLEHPLPRPMWVDYGAGFLDLDRDDIATWLVDHPSNAAPVAELWESNRNAFEPEYDFAGFRDLLKDALTEEDAHVRDFLEAQPWMTKLNEGVQSYQRHLSENGAAPYAAARGTSGEEDHDHVLENWPEVEFAVGRSLGLDTDQVLDVVGHWLENGGATARR